MLQASSLVVSCSPHSAATVGKKLACHGVPVVTTLSSSKASHWLAKKSDLLDVVFYDCMGADEDGISVTQALRQSTNKPLVAVCDTRCPRRVMSLIRAGAFDCIDSSENFGDDLRDCLQRLARLPASSQPGKIISVISPAGGCGTSTLAANIAVSIGKHRSSNKNTLIELNTSASTASLILDLDPQHTLQSLSEHAEYLDQEMIDKAYATHASGLRLLASQRAAHPEFKIDASLCGNMVRWAQLSSEYVVIDYPSASEHEHLQTLSLSHAVVVVTRLDFPCTMQCCSLLDSLRKLGISNQQIVLVANRCNRRTDLDVAQVSKVVGCDVQHRLPEDPVAPLAANMGSPLVFEFSNSKLTAALSKLSVALSKS